MKSNYLAAGFNFIELIDLQAQLETGFLTPQMHLKACMEKENAFRKES